MHVKPKRVWSALGWVTTACYIRKKLYYQWETFISNPKSQNLFKRCRKNTGIPVGHFLKVNYSIVLVWFMISTCVFSYKRHHRDDQSDGRCGSPCCLSCNPKLLQEWHAQQSHDKSFYKGMYKVRSNLSSTAHKGLLNSFWFCLGRLLTTVRSPSFCTVFLVTQELTLTLRSS